MVEAVLCVDCSGLPDPEGGWLGGFNFRAESARTTRQEAKEISRLPLSFAELLCSGARPEGAEQETAFLKSPSWRTDVTASVTREKSQSHGVVVVTVSRVFLVRILFGWKSGLDGVVIVGGGRFEVRIGSWSSLDQGSILRSNREKR